MKQKIIFKGDHRVIKKQYTQNEKFFKKQTIIDFVRKMELSYLEQLFNLVIEEQEEVIKIRTSIELDYEYENTWTKDGEPLIEEI